MPRTAAIACLTTALLIVGATVACAESNPTDAVEPRLPSAGYWYQIVAVDGASAAMMFSMRFAEGPGGADTTLSDALFVGGLAGGMLGAPAVHVAHGRPLRALGSLALHVLLPVLGPGIALGATDCGDALCDGFGAAMSGGWFAGMAVASAIDAGLTAYSFRSANAESVASPPPAPRLGPTVGFNGQAGFAGLAGTF